MELHAKVITLVAQWLSPTLTAFDHKDRSKAVNRTIQAALSARTQGDLEGSVKILEYAIKSGERCAFLLSMLARAYYEVADYASAAATYAEVVELEPLQSVAHFNLGVANANLKSWNAAVACFQKTIELDSTFSEALLGLGIALINAGTPARALDPLAEYLRKFPNHEQALFAEAVALQEVGRHAESVGRYRRILAHNPQSEEVLVNLIDLFLKRADIEAARRYAAMLLELEPQSADAARVLATVAFADADFQNAVRHCETLSRISPDSFEIWFNLGVAYHGAGEIQKASNAYRTASKVNPGSADALGSLGATQHELGDLLSACATYGRALKLGPPAASLLWNAALVLEQLNEPERAEKLYSQIPDCSPESCDAAFQLGLLGVQRGDYAVGAQYFESCLAKRPQWAEAWFNAGTGHMHAGQLADARRCLREALNLEPTSVDALRSLAELALLEENFDEAYDRYSSLVESGDQDAVVYYHTALLCQKRGLPTDAIFLYRQALNVEPDFGEALLNLGHALMSLGKEDEARAYWLHASRVKPELMQVDFTLPNVAAIA